MNKGESIVDSDSNKALLALMVAMIAGVIGVVLFALQSSERSEIYSVSSVGIMISGAFLLIGGVLGFLFGIPRTLQQESSGTDQSNNASGVPIVGYRANTNLEQISDWLTKMLVGVGLTQLTAMPEYLNKVSLYIAGGLGDNPSSQILAMSIVLYFSMVGFLFGYLWTRLFLAGSFRQADLMSMGLLASRVEQTDRKLERLKKQSEIDVEALNLAYRQLNPSPDLPVVTQEALNSTVASASLPVKVQIFNKAWSVRSDNWRDKKPIMERTIPIFRALIKFDSENRYHMNHGQLGFALKDQKHPDWVAAELELTTAIEMRGPWMEHGWLFYELNRAICHIMLDESFLKGAPAKDSVREAILSDLRAVAESDLKDLIHKDATIKEWIKVNNIKQTDLDIKTK